MDEIGTSASSPVAIPGKHLVRFDVGQGRCGPEVFKGYQSAIASLFNVELPNAADADTFSIEVETYQMSHAALRRARSAAQHMRRGSAEISRGADQILLYLQTVGRLDSDCAGRQISLLPGEIAIFDYARPIESRVSAFEQLTISIERSAAPAILRRPEAHGFRMDRDAPMTKILAALMSDLFARGATLTIAQAEAAAQAALVLAASSLEDTLRCAEQTRRADVTTLLAQAQTMIEECHTDPLLSPARIGERLRVSRSTLYRVFELEGGVREAILGVRLRSAARRLASDALPASLSELARSVGFVDARAFKQAFVARYGQHPQEFGVQARAQDEHWFRSRLQSQRLSRPASLAAPLPNVVATSGSNS